MYLGENRRWVPLSFKLVGSKFNRYRSRYWCLILVILTIPERLSTRKKPSTWAKTGSTANFAIHQKLFAH